MSKAPLPSCGNRLRALFTAVRRLTGRSEPAAARLYVRGAAEMCVVGLATNQLSS